MSRFIAFEPGLCGGCGACVVLWEAVANMEMEVVLIDQDLGY